ncbi:MAG: polyprenyl synthetase family protein [Actinomycetaceae bacterium]|nr:polyprenyl synthetase family protein [Actinomycetaceae bacterium]
MTNLEHWKHHIDKAVVSLLEQELTTWRHIAWSDDFFFPLHDFISTGKRTRALLSIAGYLLNTPEGEFDYTTELPQNLLYLCCALEFYQASALVHDDIIDEAETRRGAPSLHRSYAHAFAKASPRPQAFGEKAAILCGDFLLSLADHLVARTGNIDVISHFSHMTAEVAIGQFLDVRADEATTCDQVSLNDAMDVLTIKAANYSVVHPTILGALLSGCDKQVFDSIRAVTKPWGLAFQLRDDQLGVCGNSQVTGKPAGDDIRTGKKTPLIAFTLKNANAQQTQFLCSVLGNPHCTDAEIMQVIDIMTTSGALEQHENLIQHYREQGNLALNNCQPSQGRTILGELGEQLINRLA